jgi:hypothetical protein
MINSSRATLMRKEANELGVNQIIITILKVNLDE